jgi:hypothetical protein
MRAKKAEGEDEDFDIRCDNFGNGKHFLKISYPRRIEVAQAGGHPLFGAMLIQTTDRQNGAATICHFGQKYF